MHSNMYMQTYFDASRDMLKEGQNFLILKDTYDTYWLFLSLMLSFRVWVYFNGCFCLLLCVNILMIKVDTRRENCYINFC